MFFKNREFRVRMVKTPVEEAKEIADAVVADITKKETPIEDKIKDVVFYTAYTATAAVVVSTAAITAGRIASMVAYRFLK